VVFNRSYQIRAKRGPDLVSVGEMLEELARRADARRRRRKAERLEGVQLELPFPTDEPNTAKPLEWCGCRNCSAEHVGSRYDSANDGELRSSAFTRQAPERRGRRPVGDGISFP
jgi:hypothetical protein